MSDRQLNALRKMLVKYESQIPDYKERPLGRHRRSTPATEN